MDAAVEMSGMREANNYNSVTYSVVGNIIWMYWHPTTIFYPYVRY